ncbi:MAG: NlpC/P60 family protein [Patescibacteria group bacterium]
MPTEISFYSLIRFYLFFIFRVQAFGMRKILALCVVLGWFTFLTPAFAATLAGQEDAGMVLDGGTSRYYQFLCQRFTALASGQTNGIEIYHGMSGHGLAGNPPSTDPLGVNIGIEVDHGQCAPGSPRNQAFTNSIAGTEGNIPAASGTDWHFYPFSKIGNLVQGNSYYVWIIFEEYTQVSFGTSTAVFSELTAASIYPPNNNTEWLGGLPVGTIAFRVVSATQNQPSLLSISQTKSDGIMVLAEGETTTEDSVVFGAELQSSSTDLLRLEVEYTTGTFSGIANATSTPVAPGSVATATATGLINGDYRWRARVMDEVASSTSDWQEFGTAGNVDFIINNLGQNAASLAKALVNSAYLWGGKGWDYDLNQFVAPEAIKGGYSFWNQAAGHVDVGVGVDCSGLIMWAFNRSSDPSKPRFQNLVKAEGADEQFRRNTIPTTESNLTPGDAMFFDFNGDDFIDHVAMYVGEGDGYNVVSASNPAIGIIPESTNHLKQIAGFISFKRVVPTTLPTVLATAHSPVDLILTDPDGFTITPTTTIPSDLEYLREAPGGLYYSEAEKGLDGNPIDRIYSYDAKTGDYVIQILPAPNAQPAATYTLDFSVGGQTIVLAQNVPIGQIPQKGYGITISPTGTVNSFIPVIIDIKPGILPNSINLGSNGVVPVVVFGSAALDVHQINPATIKLANASVRLRGSGQPMASYSDMNNDGFTDIVVQISTEALQLTSGDVVANLEGRLADGATIKGSDSVRIVQ